METNQQNYQEQELLKLAKEKVKKIKNFYIHLLVYAIGLLIYVLKEYFGAPLNFIPVRYLNCLVMSIWTFIIVVEAIDIFMREVVFGKKWENRKVKSMLEHKTEKQIWK